MGSRTMLSITNAGNSGSAHSTPSSYLTRQPSVFQNAINEPGKNFGSMNIDEFLKNIWTTEESQAMAVAMASGGTPAPTGRVARQPSLHRQGSFSHPRTSSRKMVEETCREIQCIPESNTGREQNPRQITFGEMTLEDFLSKAGMVREGNEPTQTANTIQSLAGIPPAAGATSVQPQVVDTMVNQSLQCGEWPNYSQQQHQQLLQQAEVAAVEARTIGHPASLTLPGNRLYDGFANGVGIEPACLTSGLSVSPVFTGSPTYRKKRGVELLMDKTVERRQRRMIKNRESASRSRARKQAYTVELEAEVTQLKEENMRLKKQQAVNRRTSLAQPLQQPRRVLRRTLTASW